MFKLAFVLLESTCPVPSGVNASMLSLANLKGIAPFFTLQ